MVDKDLVQLCVGDVGASVVEVLESDVGVGVGHGVHGYVFNGIRQAEGARCGVKRWIHWASGEQQMFPACEARFRGSSDAVGSPVSEGQFRRCLDTPWVPARTGEAIYRDLEENEGRSEPLRATFFLGLKTVPADFGGQS